MEPGGEGAAGTRDRDFRGALLFGAGLVASSLLAYAFNAAMGRRLSPEDFGTFAALLAVVLALSGPTTALFGGAAMSAARSGRIALPPWRFWIGLGGFAAVVMGLSPLPLAIRLSAWLAFGCAMWLLVSWNRGLLIGLGHLGLVGGTMALDGAARLFVALVLVARGWRVTGATAGLALGIGSSVLITELLLPKSNSKEKQPLPTEIWVAAAGLLFLTLAQFPDVIAVRLANANASGSYAAASSIARIALYAQGAAAAYALRRAAVKGARRAFGRSILLALGPGLLALGVIEAVPRFLLSVTYRGRYVGASGLVRTLGVALFLSGVAFVLSNLMMGAGRVGWAWSVAMVSIAGTLAIFALGGHAYSTAAAMVVLQAILVVVAAMHVRRLLIAEGDRGGEIVFLTWRDKGHPQGGGSEVYVEEVAARLAETGRRVTIFCSAHAGAPTEEVRNGVLYVRRGSWRTVYLWAGLHHILGRFGSHEVVVDVQNGIPFFAPLYCGRRVIVLVHHVHREQWGMVFGPRLARAGWWVESHLAPRVYRRSRYIAVSNATRDELVQLGVDHERITVVRNGTSGPSVGEAGTSVARAAEPTIAYLGRLVPHKRIELILDAAAQLRGEFPDLRVQVIGQGTWDQQLREHAAARALDGVSFEGFVDDVTKRRLLARAWVLVQPSLKEGWGLSVVEAAAMGTPAVAFPVGGLTESIVDGETGLLAETFDQFVDAIRLLLQDPVLRETLGRAARERSTALTWESTAAQVLGILGEEAPAAAPVVVVESGIVVEPA